MYASLVQVCFIGLFPRLLLNLIQYLYDINIFRKNISLRTVNSVLTTTPRTMWEAFQDSEKPLSKDFATL